MSCGLRPSGLLGLSLCHLPVVTGTAFHKSRASIGLGMTVGTCRVNVGHLFVGRLLFDVQEVRLETEQGMLQIKGEDLHVSRLTLERGEIDIDGRIDSFVYMDEGVMGGKKESLWERMFR